MAVGTNKQRLVSFINCNWNMASTKGTHDLSKTSIRSFNILGSLLDPKSGYFLVCFERYCVTHSFWNNVSPHNATHSTVRGCTLKPLEKWTIIIAADSQFF